MKKIELFKILQKYPLFSLNDFTKIANKSAQYCRTYLYRLKKEKLIFEIERGKYTVYEDSLIFSSFIILPSYISFWTALRFYNLTDQLPMSSMVASKKSKKEITFQGTKIKFYKIKDFWGYHKIRYNNFNIFMAEPEKCLIDCLSSKSVPLHEIVNALDSKEINTEKLKEYSFRTKNSSLIKRVGFLLEQKGIKAEELLSCIDYNYIKLDVLQRKKGKKNKKWRIIENI